MATEIIEKSMYNGEINIKFFPKSHQYKKDGENILSVSAISGIVDKSAQLMYWATHLTLDYLLGIEDRTDQEIIRACNLYNEKKEEACDIGTKAHEWVEKYIKTGEMSLPDDEKVANAVNGFLNWKKEHNIEFLISERLVYSKKYNYVGILDIIAIIDGKKYLIDIKTSNAIYILAYGMQTVGYKKAYEEEINYGIDEFIGIEEGGLIKMVKNPKYEELDGIMIVKFAKDEFDKKGNPISSFEVQEIVDIEYFFNAFLSAKTLKEAVKKYDTYNK